MIVFSTQHFLPDIGGVQIYVTGLADALWKRGHSVEIYCDAADKDEARKVSEAREYEIIRFGGLRPLMRRLKARAVARRLSRGDVSSLIVDSWKSLEHIPKEALAGVKVLCLAHGNEFLSSPTSTKGKRIAACVAKSDIVAANSRFTAGLVEPFLNPRTRVQVIWPGVTPPDGVLPDLTTATDQSSHIVSIARLEPRKGIDMVLRALPSVAELNPTIRYDIIGKGDDETRLKHLASSLGVEKYVRFHGLVSEEVKARLLRQASIFALPNRREGKSVEGFGIVFMEAAAYGVPSVAGSDGGAPDAVIDGETGMIADGRSDRAVANALLRLLGDNAWRQTLGSAARKRFWQDFAWDSAVGRFENALFGA